jgi:hypothetical protein
MGRNAADILVAIRSGLVTQSSDGVSSQEARYGANGGDSGPKTKVSIYAGAGLVPGSTVQGDEISDDDVDKIFEHVDIAGTGYLEYSEFVIASLFPHDLFYEMAIVWSNSWIFCSTVALTL